MAGNRGAGALCRAARALRASGDSLLLAARARTSASAEPPACLPRGLSFQLAQLSSASPAPLSAAHRDAPSAPTWHLSTDCQGPVGHPSLAPPQAVGLQHGELRRGWSAFGAPAAPPAAAVPAAGGHSTADASTRSARARAAAAAAAAVAAALASGALAAAAGGAPLVAESSCEAPRDGAGAGSEDPLPTVDSLSHSGHSDKYSDSGSVSDGDIHRGCLSRHSIADAVEKAAPAVVNLTVSVGRGLFSGESMGSGSIIRPDGLILTNAHVVAELVEVRQQQEREQREEEERAGGGRGGRRGRGGFRRMPPGVAGPRLGTGAKLAIALVDGRTFEGELVGFDIATDLALVRIIHRTGSEPPSDNSSYSNGNSNSNSNNNKTSAKTPAPQATVTPGEGLPAPTVTPGEGVPAPSVPDLPTVRCGSSKAMRPGDWVVALGSPLRLHNSVTVGVVSSVDRTSAELGLEGGRTEFIQTDAAINEGNSGGPLLNLDGELVGINSMKALGADGISFAVPIDTALHVIQQLERHGRVMRPFLGIKMLELTPTLIQHLQQQDPSFPAVAFGVLVPQVIPGSPAEKAGIRAGDVIVALNDVPVKNSRQIVEELGDKVGVTFRATVKREGDATLIATFVTEEAGAAF